MSNAKAIADKYITADGSNPDSLDNNQLDAMALSQDQATGDKATVARLAAMDPLEYDRCRAQWAEHLGVRASTLDAQVKRLRGDGVGDDDGAGGAVALADPEPWPEPVDGGELLDALAEAVRRHLVVPAGAAEAVALWTLHAHAHDTANISPILAVTSPTPECGKTTLLTLLGALTPRPLPASNITAAALFRAVEKWHPCLLVDEADTFLRDSDDLRGVLNSGHNRHSAWVIRTTGEDHEPRRFMTWAPKVIALIGKLAATLASRAVHIELRRIGAGECVEPLRGDRLAHLEPLARQAARWAQDNADALADLDPEMPAGLRGRAADNWRHLLVIADLAGGHWPQRGREAAEVLSAGRSEQTAGIMLLEDIRALFTASRTDRLTSAELISALIEMESRPWPEWGRNGKAITQRGVAKLLDSFKIEPRNIKTLAGTVSKGYRLDQFDDAFARYLPAQSATPLPSNEINDLGHIENATEDGQVADFSSAKLLKNNNSSGVADTEPQEWETPL